MRSNASAPTDVPSPQQIMDSELLDAAHEAITQKARRAADEALRNLTLTQNPPPAGPSFRPFDEVRLQYPAARITEESSPESVAASSWQPIPIIIASGGVGTSNGSSSTIKLPPLLEMGHSTVSLKDGCCCICLERPREILLAPCGHACTCTLCHIRIKSATGGGSKVRSFIFML